MIEIKLTLMNDQAEALARVLPEAMEHLMADTALEETSPERADDLTKVRAVLGNILNLSVTELKVIAKLRAADRQKDRLKARNAFSRGRHP